MSIEKLEAKIASIEAQLKILKASKDFKKAIPVKKDLRSLKGFLKGKGKFDIKEIESIKAGLRKNYEHICSRYSCSCLVS